MSASETANSETKPPEGAVDVIDVAPLEDAPAGGAAGMSAPPAVSKLMDRDQFFQFFGDLFSVTGNAIGVFYPPPLGSLVNARNAPSARGAADALYDMALEIPWLKFLLDEDAIWVARLAIIGTFGSQVYNATRKELAERKQLAHAAHDNPDDKRDGIDVANAAKART